MSSKLSASPRTAHTAITRMSSSRCSTFHSHLGSSTVSNAAIKVSSMASLRRKAEPLAGQAAEMEALISCVTPGCEEVYEDHASGAKAERPGLAEALGHLRRGDTLVVWKLDRLGRSMA